MALIRYLRPQNKLGVRDSRSADAGMHASVLTGPPVFRPVNIGSSATAASCGQLTITNTGAPRLSVAERNFQRREPALALLGWTPVGIVDPICRLARRDLGAQAPNLFRIQDAVLVLLTRSKKQGRALLLRRMT
jgi:hypothetical protein